jgi:diacylglycerol O-acyltransferase
MKRLGLLDTGFLLAEKRETPMHVAGLHLFTLPARVNEQTFLHGLVDELRGTDGFQSPFGDRLRTGPLGLLGRSYWEHDEALDPDYHIRHSALPKPGRYRELFALVSRLHGQMLDRSRPLWEMHLIEGLPNREFAVYIKFHHAAIDGVGSIHLTRSMYASSPRERRPYSPLSASAAAHYREQVKRARTPPIGGAADADLRNVAEALKSQFDSGAHVLGALKRIAGAWTGAGGSLTVPWRGVPQSPINTEVDGARRFVAQSWPFDRVRAVGKALGGTFNDTVLAMCAGALRTYLDEQHGLPDESLKAMVPISLRRPGDLDSANAVGAITADLATDIADPGQRFRAIQASVQAGKEMFQSLSSAEAQVVMNLLQLPNLFLTPLGLTSRFPPFSTVISNVPGPREPLYWNGARLRGLYPASIVFDGFALNLTLVTYHDQVDFGIVACRRTMPQVQRVIDHLETSLAELEAVAGLAGPATGRAPRRAAARKRVGPKAAVLSAAAQQTAAKKSAAKKSGTGKAATERGAARKSAAKKGVKKKAAKKKGAAKQSAAKKTTAGKSAAKQGAARKQRRNRPAGAAARSRA